MARFRIEVTIETDEPDMQSARDFVDGLPFDVGGAVIYEFDEIYRTRAIAQREQFGTWTERTWKDDEV